MFVSLPHRHFPKHLNGEVFFYGLFQTFLIAGVSAIAYEYFLRGEIINMNDQSSDRVIKQFSISKGCADLGMAHISRDTNTYDFSSFILDSREIFIVLNDGRTWTSRHEADLSERMKKPGLKTHFILVHPQSPFLAVLAKKINSTEEKLRHKIEETIDRLVGHAGADHHLEIFGHDLPTCFTLFINESIACTSPYPMALKADRLPMYVFENTGDKSFYSSLRRDMIAVISQAHPLHPPSLLSKDAAVEA